jgi:hypothetical protein
LCDPCARLRPCAPCVSRECPGSPGVSVYLRLLHVPSSRRNTCTKSVKHRNACTRGACALRARRFNISWIGHGNYYVKQLGGLQHLGKLAILSFTLCVVSATFWAWASYKLLALHDADLGVVSFLIAFTMSYRTCDLCAVQVSRVSSRRRAPLSQQRTLHPLALIVVVVNYLYVLLMIDGLPSTFQLYLLIGAVYWIGAAAGIWMLLSDENVERLPLIDSGSGGPGG